MMNINNDNDKKEKLRALKSKIIITLSVCVSILLLSVIGVAANTVPYTIIDGNETYVVNIVYPDVDALIEKAEEAGMKEFSELDDALIDEFANTLTINRAVNLTLDIEGALTVIHANEGQTVSFALDESGINKSGQYKVLPAADTVIEGDMLIRLTSGYIVYINGNETEVMGDTVAEALRESGIDYDSDDSITPDLGTSLYSGIDISFTEGYTITVKNGSFTAETSTFATTVEEFLKERNITLDSDDKLSIPTTAAITDGTEIAITRVYTLTQRENVPTDFGTDYEYDVTLFRGKTKVKTEGTKGIDEVTYKCVYENGELISKEEISRELVKEPVNEVVLKGPDGDYQNVVAASVIGNSGEGDNYFIDHEGNKVYYKRQLYGSGTAYCIPNGITSVGFPVGRGMVAVDPKLIPYGSKLYITCGSYCYGYGIAGDTGGALMAGTALVDLYMDTLEDCTEFGRRNMTVYIIE